MRSSLRSLAVGLTGLLSAGAMAQYPYTWIVQGQVSNCYPGQTVNVQTTQGTLPAINWNIAVDSSNCTFTVTIPTTDQLPHVQWTTLCGGTIVTYDDSTFFNALMDTMVTSMGLFCGAQINDCMGILNGPNVPGTACDDGNPLSMNDAWNGACVCQGYIPPCNACFTIQPQNTPWTVEFSNCTGGVAPFNYQWTFSDGSASTQTAPTWTIAVPGTYIACLTITDANACVSTNCDTLYVDSAGTVTGFPSYYDCLGVYNGPTVPGTPCQIPGTILQGFWSTNCTCDSSSVIYYDCYGWANGPNLPGTACSDTINGVPYLGVWSANCLCTTNGLTDCLGIVNGPNLPGTPCDDGDTLTVQDTWTPNCGCSGVIANWYDCLGIFNGFNVPGTPCDDQDPATINDMWDASCNCVGGVLTPCEANFWVLQAVTYDSLNQTTTPIPYELWIWNLSSGGSGTYTTFWNFGDGSSSTAQFPTHTYAGNGPYWLCLTIDDGAGCQSTYCDSVSIDGNGLYTGMLGGGSDRQNGFTINIQAPQTTGLTEQSVADGIATWPNPVADELNIALTNALSGTADVTVLDLNGRVVMADRRMLANGRNQLLLQTNTLAPGLYTVRIGNAEHSVSQRFVKVN